jgi:hypothetical protein
MKKIVPILLACMTLVTCISVSAQTRTRITANVNQGEYIDLGTSYLKGDTLQVTDTVAYIIPITHANDLFPYFNLYWNKSGAGTATITMSFFQSNDPTNSTNFKPVVAGVSQATYTKTLSLSASAWNEVSFARDTARFEGRYLKVQYVTSATANVGGKMFTRVKTVIK